MIAVKDMEKPTDCIGCRFYLNDYCNYRASKPIADNCPLVEIITCKDCKYYREDDDTGYCTNHTCGDIVFWCRDDYYCADAMRKDVANG